MQSYEIYDSAQSYFQAARSGNTFTRANQTAGPYFRGGGWVELGAYQTSTGAAKPSSAFGGLKAERVTFDTAKAATVSNTGNTRAGHLAVPQTGGALQKFTTGDAGSAGFEVTSISLDIRVTSAGDRAALTDSGFRLYLDRDGRPVELPIGSFDWRLTTANTVTPAVWKPPVGVTMRLASNTDYWIGVTGAPGGGGPYIGYTTSGNQTGSDEWSLDDGPVETWTGFRYGGNIPTAWSPSFADSVMIMTVNAEGGPTAVNTRPSHGELSPFHTYPVGQPLVGGAAAVDLANQAGDVSGTSRWPSSRLWLLDPTLVYRFYVDSVTGTNWASWSFKVKARPSLHPFEEHGLPLDGSGRFRSWVQPVELLDI